MIFIIDQLLQLKQMRDLSDRIILSKSKVLQPNKVLMGAFLFKKVRYKSSQSQYENDQQIFNSNEKKGGLIRRRLSSEHPVKTITSGEQFLPRLIPNPIDKILKWNALKSQKYQKKFSLFSEKPPNHSPLEKNNEQSCKVMNSPNRVQKSLKNIKVRKINFKQRSYLKIKPKLLVKQAQKAVKETQRHRKQKGHKTIVRRQSTQNNDDSFCPWSSQYDEEEQMN